jgi:hypothetical protein
MDFEAFHVDAFPVDQELRDAGCVGPELAHLAGVYCDSPRALVWRNPSSDWRVLALLLPLASRLSLMANPIFAQLARAWGLNVRFVGVDRDGLVYDFRSLLRDRTLKLLLELLAPENAREPALLDTLFAALADEMLTVLQRRRLGWGRHLVVDQRLEPQADASIFQRETRFPDFLAKLRAALRDEIVDVDFYGRVLRSVDLRETAFEQRVASLVESSLDAVTMAKLARTGVGRHLGCYNWLRLDLRHAAPRAHVLASLPGLATFFAETLVPLDAARLSAEGHGDDPGREDLGGDVVVDDRGGHGVGRHDGAGWRDEAGSRAAAGWREEADWDDDADWGAAPSRSRRDEAPPYDLRAIAARSASLHSAHWSAVLHRAIDAGQDRAVIEALAQRFEVGDNVIRRLWRERPQPFGQPPAWHLASILRCLHQAGERAWPTNEAQWRELISRALPHEA